MTATALVERSFRVHTRRRRDHPSVVDDEEKPPAGWWAPAATHPALRSVVGAGPARPALSGDNGLSATDHEVMLRAAGFSEVGVVWRRGPSAVVVAVR